MRLTSPRVLKINFSGPGPSAVNMPRSIEPVSDHSNCYFTYVCRPVNRVSANNFGYSFFQPTQRDLIIPRHWRRDGCKSYPWITAKDRWSIYWRSQSLGIVASWARKSLPTMDPISTQTGETYQCQKIISLLWASPPCSGLLCLYQKEPNPSMKVYLVVSSACILLHC